MTWPVAIRRWPFGDITSCTTVPTGSGGDRRTNMPSGDRSWLTARSFLPFAMTSTGRFIATR